MQFEIKNRYTLDIIFKTEASNFKAAIEFAIESRADLSGADLSGANLSWANLSRADLSGANLSGADLSWANLPRADLSWANLSGADLSGANLSGADLSRADLSGANLSRTDLSGADLSWANLSRANLSRTDLSRANLSKTDLSRANLSKTKLPSPTMVLLACWGSVSAKLCADLMMYDASCHPDQTAFDKWAAGGLCPYSNIKVQRACNFKEQKELWGKGKFRKPYNLMLRLFKEKCIEF